MIYYRRHHMLEHCTDTFSIYTGINLVRFSYLQP